MALRPVLNPRTPKYMALELLIAIGDEEAGRQPCLNHANIELSFGSFEATNLWRRSRTRLACRRW